MTRSFAKKMVRESGRGLFLAVSISLLASRCSEELCRSPSTAAALPPGSSESALEEPRNDDPIWRGGWTNIVPGNRVGQTFVAKDPVIRQVDVNLLTTDNRSGKRDKLTLVVLDDSGAPIARASRTIEAGFDGWLTFALCQPAGLQVTPGARFRLWLKDTGKVLFGWRYGSDRYHSGISFMGGKEDPRFDFLFRVVP